MATQVFTTRANNLIKIKNHNVVPMLVKLYSRFPSLVTLTDYITTGFLSLQQNLDFAIMQTLKPGIVLNRTRVMMRRFPYPPYETDSFDVEVAFVKLLRLAFLFYIVNIVKDVIKDKEEKMKVCIRSHTYFISIIIILFIT